MEYLCPGNRLASGVDAIKYLAQQKFVILGDNICANSVVAYNAY